MSTRPVAKREALSDAARLTNTQHGCGPEQFAGTSEALYEQHQLETSVTAEPQPRWKLLLEVYDYARLRAKPEVTRSTPLRKVYEAYERRLILQLFREHREGRM
jgi:hypothetical protein